LRVGLAAGLSEKLIDFPLWREFAGFVWWGFNHENIAWCRSTLSKDMIGRN